MNTPETPVHIRLWHREFWLMAFASLLLTMSVYILIPIMPRWLMEVENFTPEETGLSMGVFALGLYLLGAQCSWLVQHYRRNVVCMWAIFAVALDVALLWYIDSLRTEFVEFWIILLQRFALGAFFGLAQMVLSSTLIIDTCESSQRTEANQSATWFSRLALAVGPMVGLGVYEWLGFHWVVWVAAGCAVLTVLLVKAVDFPFRTPEDDLHVASLDRFFLTHGTVLYLHLMWICMVVGLLLSLPWDAVFYALMLGGFLLAVLVQHFLFPNAEMKSELVSGQMLLLAAVFVLMVSPDSAVPPVLVGLSVGVIASRFLLFFIKLSRHCQRGTSQSTYFLAWETGLTLGIAIGYGLLYEQREILLFVASSLIVVSLLVYHLFTHSWFMNNKNR